MKYDNYKHKHNMGEYSWILRLLQMCYIIIDRGVSATDHGKEVLHGLNTTAKRFIFHLMIPVPLPGSQRFDTQMAIHTSTHNSYVSSAQKFQKHLSNASHKHSIFDYRKHKKRPSKKVDKQKVSCAKT